ncbi:hypothetical protein AC578_5172 [Pseudocercospora eumusae]|uniref:BTB domain-containing protein n=1 Tax=Pseudocercospora eumusae TaxID=321146 RepID=A0A139HMH4_9PEZI|nr:hypothetical protein AC578_5172 [Pseudocercospora eumusae]
MLTRHFLSSITSTSTTGMNDESGSLMLVVEHFHEPVSEGYFNQHADVIWRMFWAYRDANAASQLRKLFSLFSKSINRWRHHRVFKMAAETDDAHEVAMPAALKPLAGCIARVFHSHEYSDLVIKCEGHSLEWSTHKLVVCAYSDVLAATLHRGAQLEEKSQKNDIKLDDDPQAIEAMLYYMYNLDYGDFSNSPDHVAAIIMDVKVFTIADKYNIKALMDLAAEKFELRCSEQWRESVFADAIKQVYTVAPDHDDRLKRIVIDTVQEHAAQLYGHHNDAYLDFERMGREVAEFSADMCKKLASEDKEEMRTYKCPNQGELFRMSTPTPTTFGCPSGCHRAQTESWWSAHIQR